MSSGTLITALIGLVTTFISAWVSWFFTRKKYYVDVDSSIIQNMEESLKFYQTLSTDNKLRLDEMLESNSRMEQEIEDLRKKVTELIALTCSRLDCAQRQVDLDINN